MPDVILRIRVDPATGKRELVIDYTSDADALPFEHEDAHRKVANQVVEGGLASDKLEVTREAEQPVEEAPASGATAEPTPVANRR